MTKDTPKILCIGKAAQDVFLHSDEFDPKTEGKVAYTHLPLGAKLDVDEITFATGGNATNAAVTLARQGLHVGYMWILGNEPASQAIMAEFDAEHVETGEVVQDDHYKASYSTILLASSGERTILNFHGSMASPNGSPLNLEIISDYDWVYISSVGSIELLEKIVSVAAKNNVRVAINPASTELANPKKLKALLEDVDILLANKEEMAMLVEGETSEELARHALHFVKTAVVSDGPRGVVACDSKQVIRGGLYEDVPVIDRTGAGDAFCSGFVAMQVLGKSLADCVVFGSANSTSVVGKTGAKSGILHKGAILHDMPLHVMPF